MLRKIIQNSVFGLSSQAIGGGLFFLVTVLIARQLGPTQFGAFSFLVAVVAVFHMLADFGLTNILVREISRQKDRTAQILGTVVPFAIVAAILAYLGILITGYFLDIAPDTRQAMYVMGGTVLVAFHAAIYGAVTRAHEAMGYNAVILVTQRVILFIAALLAIQLDVGLTGFAVVYLVERVYQWVAAYYIVRHRFVRYSWKIDLHYLRYFIIEGFPLGTGMIVKRLSLYVDTFLLAAMSTASAVGLFSAAFRIVQMVNVIPFTLSIPLFPVLSRLAEENEERAFSAYAMALKVFAIIGFPIGVWVGFLGPELVQLFFGAEYLDAGRALQVMGPVIILLFLSSLYVYMFSALNRQKIFMAIVTLGLVINIIADVVLIPVWDYVGASIGTLIAEFVVFLAGAVMLVRAGFSPAYYWQLMWKPAAATAVAGVLLIYPTRAGSLLDIGLLSLGFGAVYVIMNVLLRSFGRDELAGFYRSLRVGRSGQ